MGSHGRGERIRASPRLECLLCQHDSRDQDFGMKK
jgi:hypothetical protein